MPAADRAPSVQWYPRDWMADPDVLALTWDQRGRYHWAWCCSLMTKTPGIATESQWKCWMGYSDAEWMLARDAHSACFRILHDGVWVQMRTVYSRREQRRRYADSMRGGTERMRRLTPEQRSDLARRAAQSRWRKGVNAHAECQQECLRMPGPASASASERTEESKSKARPQPFPLREPSRALRAPKNGDEGDTA